MDKLKDKLNTKLQAAMTPKKIPPPIPPRMKAPPTTSTSTSSSNPPPIPTTSKPPPSTASPPPKKRTLLWDWTSVRASTHIPIPSLPPTSPILSCHNWNTWSPPGLPPHITFRPMFRTPSQLQPPEFNYALSQPYPIMHFLNEPDRLSGVTPELAADLWGEKILPLRLERGTKIVSPATASDEKGTQWLDTFMDLLLQRDPNSLPDFLGLHYYGPTACGAIAYLTARHERYPQLPVNISEVACVSRDREEVWAFNRELADWADATEWVVEYGFFGMMRECADGFVSPAAQLMDGRGEVNEMGRWVLGM